MKRNLSVQLSIISILRDCSPIFSDHFSLIIVVELDYLHLIFYFRNWVTQIDLPLKQSMTMSDKARSIFQNIHPSLLLFLNRLQTLIIENKVETQASLPGKNAQLMA